MITKQLVVRKDNSNFIFDKRCPQCMQNKVRTTCVIVKTKKRHAPLIVVSVDARHSHLQLCLH